MESKTKLSINSVILAIYIFVVWAAYIYLNRSSKALGLFIFLVAALILAFIVSGKIVAVFQKIEIKCNDSPVIKKSTAFFAFFSLTLCVMLIWFWAFFPGAFSVDNIWQYEQAVTNSYNDWHPFWHTIVFFTIPLKLTGKTYSIVLFQMIYFSLVIGYMGMVIYKHSSLKISIISIAYILLNPYTGGILVFPIKDVGFSIAACLSMIMAAEAYFSKEWANKWWRLILLGIVLANATLFRHNGILFTLMLIIALVFILGKKHPAIVIASFIIFMFVIKIPVYNALNVEKPKDRVLEMTGLPLTIFGNVAKEAPEKLDQETLDFVYSIAPRESWTNYYTCGNFNNFKFWFSNSSGVNKDFIEEAGVLKMFYTAIKCFKYAPEESLDAFISLTDMVYSTECIEGDLLPYISGNPYNITFTGNIKMASVLKNYKRLVSESILKYFRIFGVALLFMTIAIVGKSNFKSFDDWKRILLCLPIYTYDFGTMLLLSGDDSRFFYITFLVAPLVGVILLWERNK